MEMGPWFAKTAERSALYAVKERGVIKETSFGELSLSSSLWSCDLGIDQFT